MSIPNSNLAAPAASNPMTMSTAPDLDSHEWETVIDDGFLYKRKKRRFDPSAVADPPPDPQLEARHRTLRRRAALLKVRQKYQAEIALWERLSNTLAAMDRTITTKENQAQPGAGETLAQNNSATPDGGFHGPSLLDELQSQLEGQEAIIQHITSLCDVAEAICDSHEQNVNKSFLDLPVWGSPRQLMTSLCQED